MNKKNLILGGILVILIVLAYLYQGPIKNWKANMNKPENFLASVDFDQVSKIEINYGGQVYTLVKSVDTSTGSAQSRWKVDGTKDFYVREDMASSINTKMKEATLAEVDLASENKDKKQEFQTDDQGGTRIRLFQNDTQVSDFLIGRMGGDFASVYISEPDSDKTYLLKANIRSALARSDWYDKTIFSSDKEQINKIRFQYPTREFTIEKQEEGWKGTLPYTFDVDEEKVGEILDIMSNLVAADIPEQTFEGTGLENHEIIVQASGENIDHTLMVGDAQDPEEENTNYFAKKGSSDNIYLITNDQKEKLDITIRDLR